MTKLFDLAIIGGGINGCGIAADAALRGLSVVLFEKHDLGGETSSKSSKLIHGGIRYLEQYDFSLVKKALRERQLLLELAPHLIRPLPFVLPYHQGMRPAWMLRTGLFLYDNLSRKNRLPHSRMIKRSSNPNYFSPLEDSYKKGFLFYDCYTNDARLTLVNALQAKAHHAQIIPQTKVIHCTAENQIWRLQVENGAMYQAKCLINATGPWVEKTNQALNLPNSHHISLVKGSHLVTKPLYTGDQAYLLQHQDKRVVFVIPHFGHTLIGTTDVSVDASLNNIQISEEETDYLLGIVRSYFKINLNKKDIVTSFSGVRPLLANPASALSELSRDYIYDFKQKPAPIISIYGGKITTYRQLAQDVVSSLKQIFPRLRPSKTAQQPLPGGFLLKEYAEETKKRYPWLPESLLSRWLNSYGTLTDSFLSNCHQFSDLGAFITNQLCEKEINYLLQEEWASSSEDILWRRSKLGLSTSKLEEEHLSEYIQSSKL